MSKKVLLPSIFAMKPATHIRRLSTPRITIAAIAVSKPLLSKEIYAMKTWVQKCTVTHVEVLHIRLRELAKIIGKTNNARITSSAHLASKPSHRLNVKWQYCL